MHNTFSFPPDPFQQHQDVIRIILVCSQSQAQKITGAHPLCRVALSNNLKLLLMIIEPKEKKSHCQFPLQNCSNFPSIMTL